ncbi:UNC93-like protein MFSD11 [Latimeria chalumnae]|uniref:UNC93-like protein MFSD11 n=1 Tax=Latimeria chalumnae TaxID=7897 RepID=H3AZ16_LATCH|nr:PREDICTED: UNC93-like protein MFSD11 [Latimeria chalumnae]|eukprot:XP_005993257.1 PREDICTED: UNC93-like protein MFSD11 [Latimeria chalumnae]
MSPEGRNLLNIIILGFAFMFIFTAFQTCGNVEQTVIKSLNSSDFHASGYNSMAIIYGVFSASNLVTPSIVAVIGPQLAMFISGLLYSSYIAVFIQPFSWSFYTASVLLGIAAAVLWTGQGNCLTINSNANTIGRNSGIFWALLQFSLFFGNLYVYFAWRGKVHISDHDRRTVFIALTVICLVGTFLFFLIRKPDSSVSFSEPVDSDSRSINVSPQGRGSKALEAFKKALKLVTTKEMLLLSVSIGYTGLELTFFSGVYGTCIGAMNRFGADAKSLIGLSGIFIGIGEVLGGGTFGMLNKCNRYGRNPVVLMGVMIHLLAFFLIFLNIPSDAPIAPESGTNKMAYIHPSKELALLCSFLLGLGDSCFNTQLLSIVGSLYPQDSAPAFAVFKFVQSICAAIAFFYSNYLLLQWQLLILVFVGFLGTISFFFVEWEASSLARSTDYDTI